MPVTSRDVAREAGVSQPTVSRALNGDARISERTRRKVEEAASRLGYVPSAAARSLVTRRSLTVGTVVADISNPFYAELLDALHNELSLDSYRMVLIKERTDLEEAEVILPLVMDSALDGVVSTTATLDSRSVEPLIWRGTPLVLLNRYVDGLDIDRVTSDNSGGGALAAEHLLALGHRRIGMIAGPRNTSTGRDREHGFRRHLEQSGVAFDETLRREGRYTQQTGYRWGLDLLGLDDPPTAIFCGSDIIAVGVLNAANKLGVKVPETLSVVGFDDIEMAAWECFDLTTIHHPMREMATTAARLLLERMTTTDDTPPRAETFPTDLIQRGTTAPPE